MNRSLWNLAFLLFPVIALAKPSPGIQLRNTEEAATEEKSLGPAFSTGLFPIQLEHVHVGTLDLTWKVPEWPSLEKVSEAFLLIRDLEFIEHKGKKRRINWLEPDDRMCFHRAGMSAALLRERGFPLVASLTLSGSIVSCSAWKDGIEQSSHHRRHLGAECLSWPWHNALGARVGDRVYVLDPALNYDRPLTLQEWLGHSYRSNEARTPTLRLGTRSVPGGRPDPEFNEVYGLDLKEPTDIFAQHFREYPEGHLGHPLDREEAKVTRAHSAILLSSNPPWLFRNPTGTNSWQSFPPTDPRAGASLTCTLLEGDGESRGKSSIVLEFSPPGATAIRLNLSRIAPQVLGVQPGTLASNGDVLQVGLPHTAAWDGTTVASANGVLTFQFNIDHPCKDMMDRLARDYVRAVEIQAEK